MPYASIYVVNLQTGASTNISGEYESTYWISTRPVPLTSKELKGYQRDDSTAQVKQAQLTGTDPKNVINKKSFKPQDLITGGQYHLSPKTNIKLYPTLTQVYYNTVEGGNLTPGSPSTRTSIP